MPVLAVDFNQVLCLFQIFNFLFLVDESFRFFFDVTWGFVIIIGYLGELVVSGANVGGCWWQLLFPFLF